MFILLLCLSNWFLWLATEILFASFHLSWKWGWIILQFFSRVTVICYNVFWKAVHDTFYSKFKFSFSFLSRYLSESHQLTTIGGIALARAFGSKICNFCLVCLLKTHMNLNSIQRLFGIMEWKCWDNKFQVLKNI